jgi:hypothetical protein
MVRSTDGCLHPERRVPYSSPAVKARRARAPPMCGQQPTLAGYLTG